MTFRLAALSEGSNPIYWQTLDQLIGQADIPVNPDCGYIPQAEVVKTLSGMSVARGYASASWHWNALTMEQRAILRTICPGISAQVYIETQTNELNVCGDPEFVQCSAIMHWVAGEEIQESSRDLGLDLLFTHLIEVV